MKKIKIFIASSNELHLERLELIDLLQQINEYLENRGYVLQPVKWEYLDSSMGIERKQNEYNEKLRGCEICIVIYWTKLGVYTTEELDTAYNELRLGNTPKKIYVYFKEADASQITPELQAFRDSFVTKYGHFYSIFKNVDTMRLNFLLQLEAYLNSTDSSIILQISDGCVRFENNDLVLLEKVPFAGNNPQYLKLINDIKKQKNRLIKYPDDEEEKQELLNLEKELTNLGNNLLDTARRITMLSNLASSKRLQEVIRLFENGDNNGAEAVLNLNDISVDIERQCSNIDHSIAHIKEEQQLIIKAQEGLRNNIEEGRLRIKLIRNSQKEDRDLEIAKTYESILEKVRGYATDADYATFASECKDFVWELAAHGSLYRELLTPLLAIELYEHVVKCLSILLKNDSSLLPKLACSEELLASLYNLSNKKEEADDLMKESSTLFTKIREENADFDKNDIEPIFRLPSATTPEPLQRLIRLRMVCLGADDDDYFNCVSAAEECIKLLPEYRILYRLQPKTYEGIYTSLLDNVAGALYNVKRNDEAAVLWEEKLKYAKENGTIYQIVSTAQALGYALYYSNQDEKAEKVLLDAINIVEGKASRGVLTELIECQLALAKIYEHHKQNEKLELCLTKAVELSRILKEEEDFLLGEWIGRTEEELADFYYYIADDNKQAAKHYGEAASGYEWQLEKDKYSKNCMNYYARKLTNTLLLQGHSLFLSDHEEESIKTYFKALTYYEDPDISSELWWREARTYYCLCEALEYLEMYKEAKEYLTKALNIYKNHSDSMTETIIEHYEMAKEMQKKLRRK